jgi:hypothetical protein
MSISQQVSSKECTLSLLSIELSRERIREREQEIEEIHAIGSPPARRRRRQGAWGRVFRVRRISLTR